MMTPNSMTQSWKKRLLIIPPIVLGALAIQFAPQLKSEPDKSSAAEKATKVRVLKIKPMDIVPRVTGYGKTVPALSWNAVAEVAGQVIQVSDRLRQGNLIPAGEEVLTIADAEYQLLLAQIDVQLKSLQIKDKTTRASLAIAEQDLALARADFERKQNLLAKGSLSRTDLDSAQRQMLSSEAQWQTLQNTLELNQGERQLLQVQRSIAELDIQRTHLIAPFDVRITEVNIGTSEYANKGQLLFSGDGVDSVEVEALFPIGMLRPLISGDSPQTGPGVARLQANVRLRTASHEVVWPARVDRVSGVIDALTQSLTVVVVIDHPLDQASPGERPPLYRNTFVEVDLWPAPMSAQIVVPRSAIHDHQVYLVDADNRLKLQKVMVSFSLDNYAVISKGLKPGDRIVTSDMVAAVAGMLLDPQQDEKTGKQLMQAVSGREVAL